MDYVASFKDWEEWNATFGYGNPRDNFKLTSCFPRHQGRWLKSRRVSCQGLSVLKEFCVVGYWDPRGGEDATERRPSPVLGTLKLPYSRSLISESRRYEGTRYSHWWDIPPGKRARLKEAGKIIFRKKDSGEECVVESRHLLPLLTLERQTSRSNRPWGIRVLTDHPDELAIEPGPGGRGGWAYLPVQWVP